MKNTLKITLPVIFMEGLMINHRNFGTGTIKKDNILPQKVMGWFE